MAAHRDTRQLKDEKLGALSPQDEMNLGSGSGWAPEEGRTDAQASQGWWE